MNFSDVLASSIHDIKNSLSMVINIIDQLSSDSEIQQKNHRQINVLRLEAQRANNNLVQLLSVYKYDNHLLDADIDMYDLGDFLDEVVATNESVMSAMQITMTTDCADGESAFFDENLVRGVLNSALGNAQRYTDDQILISCAFENGYTVFRVEDNGKGFPQRMLVDTSSSDPSTAFTTGSTQLGLEFASMVAGLHTNGDKKGFVRLCNQHHLSGGCFELWLP